MNTCYECGDPVYSDQHFCDARCAKKYRDRYGKRKFMQMLANQTRLRKRLGLPRYIKPEDQADQRY